MCRRPLCLHPGSVSTQGSTVKKDVAQTFHVCMQESRREHQAARMATDAVRRQE